jgi:broad specificity phosphatase PhoE
VADFLRDVARGEGDAIAIAHRGILRSAYTLATGWEMLTPMPEKLNLETALILALDRDGNATIAELNMPLRVRG